MYEQHSCSLIVVLSYFIVLFEQSRSFVVHLVVTWKLSDRLTALSPFIRHLLSTEHLLVSLVIAMREVPVHADVLPFAFCADQSCPGCWRPHQSQAGVCWQLQEQGPAHCQGQSQAHLPLSILTLKKQQQKALTDSAQFCLRKDTCMLASKNSKHFPVCRKSERTQNFIN